MHLVSIVLWTCSTACFNNILTWVVDKSLVPSFCFQVIRGKKYLDLGGWWLTPLIPTPRMQRPAWSTEWVSGQPGLHPVCGGGVGGCEGCLEIPKGGWCSSFIHMVPNGSPSCLQDETESSPASWGNQDIFSPVAFSPCVLACREWLKSLKVWRKPCGSGPGLSVIWVLERWPRRSSFPELAPQTLQLLLTPRIIATSAALRVWGGSVCADEDIVSVKLVPCSERCKPWRCALPPLYQRARGAAGWPGGEWDSLQSVFCSLVSLETWI